MTARTVMIRPQRPAAYARAAAGGPAALTRAAAGHGWPAPVIYRDAPGPAGSALDQLYAAVCAGRHDALLMPLPGRLGADPGPLMGLLAACARHGVTVRFILPPLSRRARRTG
jgi:hypothetical protein